jgi:hypothetical protein
MQVPIERPKNRHSKIAKIGKMPQVRRYNLKDIGIFLIFLDVFSPKLIAMKFN